MSKKIAFFVRTMHGGGAQRAMVRLASGFAALGHEVEVLTLDPEGSFREELSPTVKLTTLGPKRIFSAIPAIAYYMRLQRPDAVIVTEPACNIAVVAAKILAQTSTCVMIREGLFPSVAVRESPHGATRMAYRLSPLLYRHADVIVAIAKDMAQDLATFARLPPERITTIAVNPVVTPVLSAKATQAPDHPWFSDDIPVILGVGRLDRQKDFATLITAFNTLRGIRPARLLIVGEGPLRPELEALRLASPFPDDIALPGFSANPFSLMASCAAFVLSSRYEGLPNVLIEALACGAPVVATDCPSGPHDVLEGGRFGSLVPVGDAQAMAEAVLGILAQPVDRAISRRRGMDFTLEISTAHYAAALFPAGAQAS